ncbi:MAG: polyprenyl synthetase family protein [Synergistales bacterium]|nr:polyprenyl synthetase family protein [Synergistales bacterium]
MHDSGLQHYMEEKRTFLNGQLQARAERKPADVPSRLWEAMNYSLLAGGKRIRPVLCFAAAELFHPQWQSVSPMAVALEMLHTASLIHDDLPCMDDDSLRRGRPTSHMVFGEGLALLAGDALFTQAFTLPLEELPGSGIPAERIVRAIAHFGRATGPAGICGGQVWDTDGRSYETDRPGVEGIARKKTATLIQTSLVTGAILAGAGTIDIQHIEEYGLHLGTSFQIVDDILDVTATAEELGKSPGKDATQGKRTYVSSYGVDGARSRAQEETEQALCALERVEGTGMLRRLTTTIAERAT